MTEPETSPEKPAASSGLDLSDLKLMPAWVANFNKSLAALPRHDEGGSEDRPHRGDRREGGDRRGRGGDRREGGRGERRDFRGRDRDRFGGDRPRGDRPRGDRPPGDRPFGDRPRKGGFRGRDRDSRDERPRRPWIEIPEAITASVHPDDKSLDALADHIRSSGHAFSLFEIARLVLSNPHGFGVRFLCDEGRPTGLFHCAAADALFLTKEEAIHSLLQGDQLSTWYQVEDIELEAPKGNFASISVCGFSGELLGPASHHSSREAVLRIHRERFANMPLEDYKRRIRTETDPELIQKWKDEQSKGRQWTPIVAEGETAATPLKNPREVEAHFRTHHADQVIQEVRDVTVLASTDKDHASPGLMLLLRRAVDGARKHPFDMAQRLAAGFERRGLKSFKRRGGKLFVSRAKPRPLAADVVLSDRIASIIGEIRLSSGGMPLKQLLQKLTPAGLQAPQPEAPKLSLEAPAVEAPTTETPAAEALAAEPEIAPTEATEATDAPATETPAAPTDANADISGGAELSEDQIALIKDLRWLVNEGYLIEYSDGLVTLGIQGDTPPSTNKPPRGPRPDRPNKPKAPRPKNPPPAAEATEAPEPSPSAEAAVESAPPPATESEATSPAPAETEPPATVEPATAEEPAPPAADAPSAEPEPVAEPAVNPPVEATPEPPPAPAES
ncbi:MAG: hypothetical protein KDK99_02340 [Verrucomicrobiales bacterium]|nr:hypothetical protein [Verrucomicrobiales bacterium]